MTGFSWLGLMAAAVCENAPVIFLFRLIVNAFLAAHKMVACPGDFFKPFGHIKIFTAKMTEHKIYLRGVYYHASYRLSSPLSAFL